MSEATEDTIAIRESSAGEDGAPAGSIGPTGSSPDKDSVCAGQPGRAKRDKAKCQVCEADLSSFRSYYQRYHICVSCAAAESVDRDGIPMRFCQQCGRFQELSAFEGTMRTCRVRLDKHAARRRRGGTVAAKRQREPQRDYLQQPTTRVGPRVMLTGAEGVGAGASGSGVPILTAAASHTTLQATSPWASHGTASFPPPGDQGAPASSSTQHQADVIALLAALVRQQQAQEGTSQFARSSPSPQVPGGQAGARSPTVEAMISMLLSTAPQNQGSAPTPPPRSSAGLMPRKSPPLACLPSTLTSSASGTVTGMQLRGSNPLASLGASSATHPRLSGGSATDAARYLMSSGSARSSSELMGLGSFLRSVGGSFSGSVNLNQRAQPQPAPGSPMGKKDAAVGTLVEAIFALDGRVLTAQSLGIEFETAVARMVSPSSLIRICSCLDRARFVQQQQQGTAAGLSSSFTRQGSAFEVPPPRQI